MRTPPGTKRNNGKRQEHADDCRNMQKTNAIKNAQIETPIENLQPAECSQLQQMPIFKIGGGGARAARRIRIRRPRLETVQLGVSNYKTYPKTCKTARTTIPRTAAYSPAFPRFTGRTDFGRQSIELLSFLVDFLHLPKLIENQRPPKTSQNLKT